MQGYLTIFVDESGDLGPLGSPFFTIAFLSTTNPLELERIIKKARQRKLKKTKKQVAELKANKSDDAVRTYVLSQIGKCKECQIDYITITKDQIKSDLFSVKNRFYNYVFGLLVQELVMPPKRIEILIDKKDNNQLLRQDFNEYAEQKMNEKRLGCKLTITHLPSHAHKGLQAVDFVAWAINRKESYKQDNYYKLIESKIRTAKRLWH